MIPRLPLRNASAMALGTSASAWITLARASSAFAFISCSSATAHGTTFPQPCLCDIFVCISLINLQGCTDVSTYVYIRNID